MTRSNAREIACHLVFEMNFNNITAGEALQTLMDDGYYPTLKTETDVYAEKPDGKQLEYLTSVVQGVQAKREELEGYISKYSVGWSLGRIARMAVAIMEVCMYEALYIDDAPVSAAINEAVQLAKGYEEPETVAFINGVLGSFVRGELAQEAEPTAEAEAVPSETPGEVLAPSEEGCTEG